jgi:hypothetical protein
LVEQVVKIGVKVLGSIDLQSFYKADVQFWTPTLKPIPQEIPKHPISKCGGLSLNNLCYLPFEFL